MYKNICKNRYKVINIKKSTNISKTRLSEAVSTNLMQQLGSLKDSFEK